MPRGQKDAAFYDSAALLVLSLLEEADKTGFQLLHEVECRSDCAFAIRESRLYPLLHGLEARGDVRSCERQTEDGTHRFYRLTRQGVKTLTCCREQWKTCRKPIGGAVPAPRVPASPVAALPCPRSSGADRPYSQPRGGAALPRQSHAGAGCASGAARTR